MATFTATYTSATGQERTVTVQANDVATARRQLRRRGIKATELRAGDKGSERGKRRETLPKLMGYPVGAGSRSIWGKRFRNLRA